MIWWVGGLIAFAIVIALSIPLMTDAVRGGISDHQRAPDAKTVDAIQHAWRAAGLSNQAAIAIMADLVFIGIYGIGCVLAGLHYKAHRSWQIRLLGRTALISGIVFLLTDYGETICQFIQLQRFTGDDMLAFIASSLRPIKMIAWTGSFVAVLCALAAERFASG